MITLVFYLYQTQSFSIVKKLLNFDSNLNLLLDKNLLTLYLLNQILQLLQLRSIKSLTDHCFF